MKESSKRKTLEILRLRQYGGAICCLFVCLPAPAATQHCARALELRPHFVNAQLGLGKVLASEDQPKAALTYLLDAERSDPRNESVHYQLASVYRKLGLTADADREANTF